MKPEINQNKIVVFTGAGISVESGLQTFRDSDGLWQNYRIEDVATLKAWTTNPQQVLNFYNDRRKQVAEATPNIAHFSIAELQNKYEVIVITQNIDDLHERAGSGNVIHLHGQLTLGRSSINQSLKYTLHNQPISIGDLCEEGSQIRPDVVWFGEDIQNYEDARNHLITAGKVLVVGTSLSVYPAANLLKKSRFNADKVFITLEIEKRINGFKLIRGKATHLVPLVVNGWLSK